MIALTAICKHMRDARRREAMKWRQKKLDNENN
jgi:hypothetical protein